MLHNETIKTANAGRRDELDALAKRVFGRNTLISHVEKISERGAIVARLRLKNASVPNVIAKYTREPVRVGKTVDRDKVEFVEEQLAHRFMATLSGGEKCKPDLLYAAPEGIILLEDLGPDARKSRQNYGFLIPRLAEAIAHLHAAGRGQYEKYCEMRLLAGLGTPMEDRRRYGKPAYRFLYRAGMDFVLTRFEVSALRYNKSAIEAELMEVARLIDNPGPFLTFIHDDLGNARQTFEVDDKLLLLDFEYSKYSHALLDFAKPIMGKFEISLKSGVYAWTGSNFSLELIDHYRKFNEAVYGIRIEPPVWQAAVTAAMTYAALTLVGRLCHLERDRNLRGTVKQNIQAILRNLFGLPGIQQSLPATTGFIAAYLKEG